MALLLVLVVYSFEIIARRRINYPKYKKLLVSKHIIAKIKFFVRETGDSSLQVITHSLFNDVNHGGNIPL